MKTNPRDEIVKAIRKSDQLIRASDAALRYLEGVQRRIAELKRSADDQHNQLAEIQRDLAIIKKRDGTMPAEWSARASCEPPNRYQ